MGSTVVGSNVKRVIRWVFWCYNVVVSFLFAVIYIPFRKDDRLPPIRNNLVLEPAWSLATKIRSRKVTSVQVVQAFIARIKDVQPCLNVVVQERFNEALEEAQKADNLVQSGEKSEQQLLEELPLLGVPFTSKDHPAIKGMIQCAGLVARKNYCSTEDAPIIQYMRNAGAIPLAITNVPEVCMWWESNNKVYGRSNNPYNFNRVVGGSSGGEGALLASAGSVFGIGSDVGGSIRLPSFFNGIFGHKPSTGALSNAGMFPPVDAEHDAFWTPGPMCRYATDLIPMLKALAGPKAPMLRLDEKVNFRKMKIYYMEDDGGSLFVTSVRQEMKKAVRKCAAHFEKTYGIKPQKVNLKPFKTALNIWMTKMYAVGGTSLALQLGNFKEEINVPLELLKTMFGKSDHTFPVVAFALFFNLYAKIQPKYRKDHYLELATTFQKEFLQMLGDDGVFLYPSFPEPACHHYESYFKPLNFVYTGIFNILGVPVTQCPVGLGYKHLPLGVQVVSGINHDRLSLNVAIELEKAFGGWESPSKLV